MALAAASSNALRRGQLDRASRIAQPQLWRARSSVAGEVERAVSLPPQVGSAKAVQLGLHSLTKRHVRLRVLVQGGERDRRSFFALCQRGPDDL